MRCYCDTSEVSLVGSCDQYKWAHSSTHYFPNLVVSAKIIQVTIVTVNDNTYLPFVVDQTH